MENSFDRRLVIDFVRNTLGCCCPDEVFESIEIEEINAPEGIARLRRINIGNTLLVYVAWPAYDYESGIRHTAVAGRNERDRDGFNRFRLVVVRSDSLSTDSISGVFVSETGKDEKMHLHFVDSPEIARASL